MKASVFPGTGAGSGPVLCLDAQGYARRMFPADGAAWHESAALLASSRQAMQSLRPDWWLLPLREWTEAWFQGAAPGETASGRPLRLLKSRLAGEDLRTALLDALRALHSVTGKTTGLALQVDGPEAWLAWAGATGEPDEADVEDVVVYLAGLLHALSGSGIGAVVVREAATIRDPAERYAALANAAAHHGWSCVLCSVSAEALPAGFDALAARPAAAGHGAWLDDDDWATGAAVAAPFIVTRVPAQARADEVLARIERWRGNH